MVIGGGYIGVEVAENFRYLGLDVELVPDFADDFLEELRIIRPAAGDSHIALGRVSVLDFNRATGWEVPAEPADSLGGLVFNTLGRAPQKGESVEIAGYRFLIVDVSGSRIARLRVSKSETETGLQQSGEDR